MRKIFLLLPFILFACSSDDTETQPVTLTKADLISSNWSLEKFTLDGNNRPINECNSQSKLEFTESKMLDIGFYLDGSNCRTVTDEYNYTFENNTLKFPYQNGIQIYAKIPDNNTVEISYRFNGGNFVYTYER